MTTFAYEPGNLPDDPKELLQALREEFWAIKRAGEEVSRFRTKKLTGTTASTQGGQALVAHGSDVAKILGAEVFVTTTAGFLVPPEHTFNANAQYSVYLSATDVVIENSAANSAGILSKAVTVLLTYEE